MAIIETKGFVQIFAFVFLPSVNFQGVCVQIGPSPSNTELFSLNLTSTDSPEVRDFKGSMFSGLASALAGRLVVTVIHDDRSGIIRELYLSGTEL
jgi:hypothetical protein